MSLDSTWFEKLSLARTLPWDQAYNVSLQTFLAQYTLHDSYWLGLSRDPWGDAIAVIRWDTFWTQGRIPYPNPPVDKWPLLLIYFEYLTFFFFDTLQPPGLPNTIGYAESEPLDEESHLHLLTMLEKTSLMSPALSRRKDKKPRSYWQPLQRTVIHGIDGSAVFLLHGGITQILCMTDEQQIINIPWQ